MDHILVVDDSRVERCLAGTLLAQRPDTRVTFAAEAGRRRGLTLMQSLMDQVKYNEVGNEVTLIKLTDRGFTPPLC